MVAFSQLDLRTAKDLEKELLCSWIFRSKSFS